MGSTGTLEAILRISLDRVLAVPSSASPFNVSNKSKTTAVRRDKNINGHRARAGGARWERSTMHRKKYSMLYSMRDVSTDWINKIGHKIRIQNEKWTLWATEYHDGLGDW